MKAVVKYTSNGKEKEVSLDNFRNLYIYETIVEVRGSDEDGIEKNVKIPKDLFISVNIAK